ncbi:MAG: GAF domain-containing sensor histidine kinase [Gemmatimonadota bacterium]
MNDACMIGAPIPMERELEERFSWFIRMRWLAAAGIFAGTWLAVNLVGAAFSPWPLYATGFWVTAYNGFFALARPRLEARLTPSYRPCILAQMGFDWVALVCLVHYSGGIQSPVALAFAFHIVIGAMLLSRRAAYLQAALASLLLAALAQAEYGGWWPPVEPGDLGMLPTLTVRDAALRWFVLSVFFAVTAVLTGSITVRLRQKEQAVVDSETALDRAYREMEALYELGQVVHATLDLKQVLALIAENGARLMGVKGCSIGLLDETGQSLLPGGAYGLSQDYLDKGPVEVARSAMVAEALTGAAVRIADVANDPRLQYPEGAVQEGVASIACVAMELQDRHTGVLRVYSAVPRQFSDGEIAFLRNLASLGAVAIESAKLYAESQALSEERAWFARTTHHQLRAPLAVMRGLLDALSFAGSLTEKQADLVERAERRIDELLDMVRDLLDLAYAQRPALHLKPEPVRLSAALGRTLETMRERALLKGVTFQAEGLDQDLVIGADPEDLRRIIANLLENAVKYTPVGGTVALRAERRADRVVVAVRDSGIGIADRDRQRIFQGFYRTEAAKATGEHGTGVGLSIVRRLVQRWHGTLELESAPDQGSCFTVNLPAGGDRPCTS